MVVAIHGPCGKTASRPGRQTRGSKVLKSLLSGAFLATVLGAILLTALSIVAPNPISNVAPDEPQTDVPTVAAAPETEAPDLSAVASTTESQAPSAAPDVDQPDVEASIEQLDTTPLAVPTATAIDDVLTVPSETEPPLLTGSAETEVAQSAPAVALPTPLLEQDVAVSTSPAPPLVQPEDEISAPEDVASVEANPVEVPVSNSAEVETAGATPDAVVEPSSQPRELEVAQDETNTGADAASVDPDKAEESPAPVVAEPTQTATLATTSSGLPTGTSGVRVNRIIGSQPDPDVAADTTTELEVDPDAPALQRFAAAFENPDGKPTLTVVLLDDTGSANAPDLIRLLPFPATIVVDSDAPNAIARMTAFRDVGAEVAFRAQFPTGALPSDVEVTLQSALEAVPEAVAFVDAGGTGLQSSRDVTNQTIEAMAEGGRGLVLLPKGLNSALRTATAEGVPAAAIYRDLDGDTQDGRVIRRSVDQAAFRARQDGSVILLARLRPQTLDALVEWYGVNSGGQVVIAPLSAALRSSEN